MKNKSKKINNEYELLVVHYDTWTGITEKVVGITTDKNIAERWQNDCKSEWDKWREYRVIHNIMKGKSPYDE